MPGEESVHRVSKLADPLAVDDAKFVNIFFPAEIDKFEDDIFYVTRAKSVQIEHAIDWEPNGLLF